MSPVHMGMRATDPCVPLDALHLDISSARTHGDRNLDAIRACLATFGQVEPLVVHTPTKRVVGPGASKLDLCGRTLERASGQLA